VPAVSAANWRVERQDRAAILALSGDWLVGGSELSGASHLRRVFAQISGCAHFRFDTSRLAQWDSDPVLQAPSHREPRLDLDLSGLPGSLQRLLALAAADHPPHSAAAGTKTDPSCVPPLVRSWTELVAVADLVGNARGLQQ